MTKADLKMNKKKSIFVNEDEFGYNEVIVELDEADIESTPIDFPVYDKPGTKEIIKHILGEEDPVLYETLPDIGESLAAYKAPDRPADLAELKNCPRCGTPLVSAIAINGAESMSFKECSMCGTLINTFKPIKYQAEVAERSELYILLAGGFGSGKSRINIEKIISHLILIPNARVVVAARTYPAIEATFVKDFFSYANNCTQKE